MRGRFLFLASLLSPLTTCTPLGVGGSITQGNCSTEGGSTNTYNIFAEWKKISPYTPTRTEAERQINYDLLIIESGVLAGTANSTLCEGAILNGGFSSTLYKALYTHDIKNKKISVVYDTGYSRTGTDEITYSFSGSCEKTRLRLSYADGSSALYELKSTKVEDDACQTSTSEN